jgi:hypothetical protein
MVKHQSVLCKNPYIRLKVVKTLNLATVLLVDLGPPEHDSLEIMNEVASSQPDLTDQPILNMSQMATALSGTACTLLGMQ